MKGSSKIVDYVPDRTTCLTIFITLIIILSILYYFHNRFWYARDDGYYAHIASQLLNGKELHRDVAGLHAGYVYYANTLGLIIFGDSLISLRYWMMFIGMLTSMLAFWLLIPNGRLHASLSAIITSTFSVIQFYNPTAHWYCLPLFLTLLLYLYKSNHNSRFRYEILGILIISIFLFRQLTGVIVAIGLMTYLLHEWETAPQKNAYQSILARTTAAIMFFGLTYYFTTKPDPFSWIIFGMWPLALLIRTALNTQLDNRTLLTIASRLMLGIVIGAAPLIIHHAINHSFGFWIKDVFIDAIALSEFAYQDNSRYALLTYTALSQILIPTSTITFLNGVYFFILIFSPTILSILLYRHVHAAKPTAPLHPLPFLALFYAIISMHYHAVSYLYFSLIPVLISLVWLRKFAPKAIISTAILCGLILMSTIAVYYHGGQPASRHFFNTIEGERLPLTRSEYPELRDFYIPHDELKAYEQVLDLIDIHTKAGETILAIPANADLFYLSKRKNPLRFVYLPFGIRDESSLNEATAILESDPPKMIFHAHLLPYNTVYTDRLLNSLMSNYQLIKELGEFRIYLHIQPNIGSADSNI